MTGGVAFEAVSQAGGLGTPIVVILNDNGMSIAPNVGALSRYMNRVRLDPGLWEAREGVEEKLTKLPAGIGAAFERLGPRFKESVKAFWAPGLWWEELDWAYLGVIDGHDVRAMRRALKTAFEAERPVVIHCATVKGKGFAPAEDGGLEGMEKWHAAKPKSISQRTPGAVAALVARAAAVHAGVRRGAGARVRARPARDRHHRGDELRHRALDPAEGDARPLLRRRHRRAAGACCSPPAPRCPGMRPVAAIYSTFLQRAFDQIVHDVCLQNLPVTFCMDRAGLVGDDGPTHHGVFDIAYLRAAAEHHADGAARRGDARPHAPHRAPDRRPGRDPLPARRRRRRRAAGGARAASRSAPARSCARASASRSSATARAWARRWARPTCWPSAGST